MKKLILTAIAVAVVGFASAQVKYDHTDSFGAHNRRGWALVEKNGKLGFIDANQIEVVPPIYDEIEVFGAHNRKGWALVEKDGKFGFIDKSGKEIVEPVYDRIDVFGAHKFKSKWAMVKMGDKKYFIDYNGKYVRDYKKPKQ
jgi:hypothetical protein